MDPDREWQIIATCSPNMDFPGLQSFEVTARSESGKVASRLFALRLADPEFDVGNPKSLVDAFDLETAVAYNFATDVFKKRRILNRRFGQAGIFAIGFIGIISIDTKNLYRGQKLGLSLLAYLKDLHAGMQWYVGLQAAPQELDFCSTHYTAMRKRLTRYYASDCSLGLVEISPKSAPGLMAALWE